MARQRMYVFERAYIDYVARLRRFGRWFRNACLRVWRCFWRGRGADAIEVFLRVCVVLSGAAMGVAYVLYEKQHGRGFSASTVFSFLLIAGYVCLLMWGWKAPVHILARATAGLAASGTIALLAIGSMAILLVFFALYLSILFLMTALSCLVFVPLLGYQKLKRWAKGITFECGYDQCSTKRGRASPLPVHICDCGAEYDNLYPNFYGLRYHVCRHPSHSGGQKKLPTSDARGRNKLRRRCAVCGGELIQTALGLVAPHSLFVVGDTNSGKTVFITQAVRHLCDHVKSIPGAEARIGADVQKEELEQQLDRLDRGQVLAASTGTVMEGLGVVLNIPNVLRDTLLYIYDAPGEHFQTMSGFGKKQGVQNAKGVVLVADPLTMRTGAHGDAAASETSPFADIADNLAKTMQMIGEAGKSGKTDIPVAVVLTKCDELEADGSPLLKDIYGTGGQGRGNGMYHRRCREILQQLDGANTIQTIEQNFENVGYFACSALGRDPGDAAGVPFEASHVLEPFLWLLNIDGTLGRATASVSGRPEESTGEWPGMYRQPTGS